MTYTHTAHTHTDKLHTHAHKNNYHLMLIGCIILTHLHAHPSDHLQRRPDNSELEASPVFSSEVEVFFIRLHYIKMITLSHI